MKKSHRNGLRKAYWDSYEAKSQAYFGGFSTGGLHIVSSFNVCLEWGLNRVWKCLVPTHTYNLRPPAPQ